MAGTPYPGGFGILWRSCRLAKRQGLPFRVDENERFGSRNGLNSTSSSTT
jgi:hypothetical protein